MSLRFRGGGGRGLKSIGEGGGEGGGGGEEEEEKGSSDLENDPPALPEPPSSPFVSGGVTWRSWRERGSSGDDLGGCGVYPEAASKNNAYHSGRGGRD